jgi:hypothetical protein
MILYLLLFLAFFAYRLTRYGMQFRRIHSDIEEIRKEIGKAESALRKVIIGSEEETTSPEKVGSMLADGLSRNSPPYPNEPELLALGRVCFLVRRHDQLALRYNSMLEMTPQSWIAAILRLWPLEFLGKAPRAVSPSNS